MDKKSRFFLSIGLIICSVATIVSLDWYLFWNHPVAGKSTLLLPFSIKKGESIEKVIEKLVIGDKIFQPAPQQQSLSRPTRSVETSFEGIFWAFALLAFAAALMFLINTTK